MVQNIVLRKVAQLPSITTFTEVALMDLLMSNL
jgi:hypothetical protein